MSEVPSPADAARQTADELLASIAAEGGRIFRMTQGPRVFILTTDEQLASRVMKLGGRPFLPVHLKDEDLGPTNSYRRTKEGTREWDIEIGAIPVEGERTVWEAAGAYRR